MLRQVSVAPVPSAVWQRYRLQVKLQHSEGQVRAARTPDDDVPFAFVPCQEEMKNLIAADCMD